MLFEAARIATREACSSTRMACCILVLATYSPPRLKSVCFPSEDEPPHSTRADLACACHSADNLTAADGNGRTDTWNHKFDSDSRQLRLVSACRLHYCSATTPLMAKPPKKGVTQKQRTSKHLAIRFNFFKEPSLRSLLKIKYRQYLTVCQYTIPKSTLIISVWSINCPTSKAKIKRI